MKITSAGNYTASQSDDLRAIAREEIVKETRREGKVFSNTSKAFKKVDDFLNLGSSRGLDMSDLNEEEKKEFLKMLTTLLKAGIVGYHEYEINGKKEKHFLVNELGDRRLYGKKLWREK